ncbi:unnamed protein product [Ostreobium quekettii]|uniref:Betaine lipid synthase n=1 Tax=Ostreobium quekettii TaxID=121088 RepID=A0A8S1JE29_9CHLO|nr:unnamed protein product [Ostreobium quekettii]|eukprot:evm.model.scf_1792.2 EVM.evm.TU.scf_1792.2   scf_1792:11318-23149(+)
MGRGGEGGPTAGLPRKMSFEKLKEIGGNVKQDLIVLKSMWFSRSKGEDHASRLESFYSPQAHAYDRFRASFLWGRQPMLATTSARIRDVEDAVWVDLGGGTGENVDMMSEYIPLKHFKAIYIVDLCHSLCEQAKKKVEQKGWKNVYVVEADACEFAPSTKADLVTFSYSLSMIPPFHSAVDKAISYLSKSGYVGVCDFYVSSKYDLPLRQMSWFRRFFWRSIFDTDNIDIGPERRNYLDHNMERVWEYNGQGSIPYVPYLRAPWYVWVGRLKDAHAGYTDHEAKVEAPPLFPPTFLYNMSWEDPEADMDVLELSENDRLLTLTSGGCNSLNLLLQGVKEVVSVDCNPAQTALLELKATAIARLPYEDVWKMFGEGRHPQIDRIYRHHLAPFMTEVSNKFWNNKLYHFERGLYYSGCMGKLCWAFRILCSLCGMTGTRLRLANAKTLEEQREIWNKIWMVRFFKYGPPFLVWIVLKFLTWIFLNRFVLWFGGGVPTKQYKLIQKDGISISSYLARTFDGVAQHSHLRTHNLFYYSQLMGRYNKESCPEYLKEANFERLKAGLLANLTISTGFFNDELKARKYTKVILMDHVDWMDPEAAQNVVQLLGRQVLPGGRVIWRSASLCPPYVAMMESAGFDVKCVQRADRPDCYYMDRVNMYNSFYVAVRRASLGGGN